MPREPDLQHCFSVKVKKVVGGKMDVSVTVLGRVKTSAEVCEAYNRLGIEALGGIRRKD